MKSYIKTLLSIVALLTVVAVGVVAKSATQKAASLGIAASDEDSLRQIAQEINKSTPMQVDKDTLLMNAIPIGHGIRYRYTLIHVSHKNFEKNSISRYNGDRLRANVCSSSVMQPVIKLKVMLEYAYYDKDGTELEIVPVDTSKCFK